MTETGLVVARFRRHVAVEDAHGRELLCLVRGRSLQPLVGDRVAWSTQSDGTSVVTEIAPRSATLTRIDARGRAEPIAVGVTQIVVVTAPRPPPDWFLVDRYLVAAELLGARGAILLNKTDLADADSAQLSVYAGIGYAVLACSAKGGAGIDELATLLAGERSVLVGQSGVGKSSLGNALLGTRAQAIGELSAKTAQGRHTTTTAALLRLANGAELIDSPGVRGYAPHIASIADLTLGFRELVPLRGSCRFANCTHLVEPDCAVRSAVDRGAVAAQRYASYRRLRATLSSLPASS